MWFHLVNNFALYIPVPKYFIEYDNKEITFMGTDLKCIYMCLKEKN